MADDPTLFVGILISAIYYAEAAYLPMYDYFFDCTTSLAKTLPVWVDIGCLLHQIRP